jgi:hypothetical protein
MPQAGSVQRRTEEVRNQEQDASVARDSAQTMDDSTRNSADFDPARPTGYDNPRPTGDGHLGRPRVDEDSIVDDRSENR